MLEMPKPIPAPLVKSPRLMADRAVPVMTPAKCRPRNSLRMLWRSKAMALLITAVITSPLEGIDTGFLATPLLCWCVVC